MSEAPLQNPSTSYFEIDLDYFSLEEEGRGSLLCPVPPEVGIYWVNNVHNVEVEVEIPVPEPPVDWDWERAPQMPLLIGMYHVAGQEALDGFDAMLRWPNLPPACRLPLIILRTVVRIERGWGGPLEHSELEPLLTCEAESVRRYGEERLSMVGKPVHR